MSEPNWKKMYNDMLEEWSAVEAEREANQRAPDCVWKLQGNIIQTWVAVCGSSNQHKKAFCPDCGGKIVTEQEVGDD